MNDNKFPKAKTAPPEWMPPQSVPDLSSASCIAIDVETSDPNLKKLGPGYFRQDGFVAGISLAVDGWTGYFPIAHEGGGNFDLNIIRDPLQKIFNLDCPKLFHNSSYDIGWLEAEGFSLRGRIKDTMIMAPLIDENRTYYSLNSLGYDYVGETKDESALREAATEFNVDAKSEMWKLPPMYVGRYAEQDTVLTLKLYNRLMHEIEKQECTHILDLEERLIPVTYAMKKKGVRIDEEKLYNLDAELLAEEKRLIAKIKKYVGFDVEIHAARSVAKAFDHLKLPYPRTEKSNEPSFQKNFLNTHVHEFPQMIVQAREVYKTRNTFLAGMKKHIYKGRVHARLIR